MFSYKLEFLGQRSLTPHCLAFTRRNCPPERGFAIFMSCFLATFLPARSTRSLARIYPLRRRHSISFLVYLS